ncbi:TLC domain-containing protein 4-like [Mytilus edulis]
MTMERLEELTFDWYYFRYAVASFAIFFLFNTKIDEFSKRISPNYVHLPEEKKITWHTYVFSMLHAFIMSFLSVYALTTDKQLWTDPIWCNSPISRIICGICVGYMIFDFYIMLKNYKQLWDWFFVFHHSATIYAYLAVMSYGVLPFFAIYRLLAEISTPFVDLRWFIDTLGYPKTSLQNMVNGVLMTLSFLIVRILVMPHFWYIVYSVIGTEDFNRIGHIRLVLVLSCFILDTINIFWFLKMCRGVKKVITLKLDANKNEVAHKND